MWYNKLPERRLEPQRESWPHCPMCGEETDTLYRNDRGNIVGCDGCISYVDAWQWMEDFYDGDY